MCSHSARSSKLQPQRVARLQEPMSSSRACCLCIREPEEKEGVTIMKVMMMNVGRPISDRKEGLHV